METTESSAVNFAVVNFLDANVIVRYLVADNVELAARAAELIEGELKFSVSILVLAEIGYVLTKVYQIERSKAVEAMIGFLNLENVSVYEIDTDLAIEAILQCKSSGRVNFVDALLWGVTRAAASSRIWTFDTKFPAHEIVVSSP